MWPLNRKNGEREQKLIRKAFLKYIDERLISVLLENAEGLRMSRKLINFAMILVNEASDAESSKTVSLFKINLDSQTHF
jgi:hypothetical protein